MDELNMEKLKQERLLEEKRKNRGNLRKVKEMEVEQK
jgi:ribosomal protein L30/L7E